MQLTHADRLQQARWVHRQPAAHLALDVLGGMHKVANHADRLVVDPHVLRAQHLDERRQRAAIYNLVLVVLVFKRQRAQRAGRRALHLRAAPLRVSTRFCAGPSLALLTSSALLLLLCLPDYGCL